MTTLADFLSLGNMLGKGSDQGNGVTTFAQPDTLYSPTAQPMTANGMQVGGGTPGQFGMPQTATGAGTGFGMNIGTGQTAIAGLAALSNIWGANKAANLAADQFKFTKDVTNTNLNNQIQSYNTSLNDRLTSRGVAQGQTSAEVQAQIDKNRLAR